MSPYETTTIRRRGESGFSLAEMLAVLALIGIVLSIGIPLVNEQLRIAEIRGAADEMGVHLRAARMLAVTHRENVVFTVSADPTNSYSYTGATVPTRTITMPGRVKILTSSATSITFRSDGSVVAVGTVSIQSSVSSATETWTISVNTMGLSTVAHTRV